MTQDYSGELDSLEDRIEQPVDAAIAEYLQALDDGKSLNIDRWLERHPSVRDQLLEFLRDQRQTSDELAGANQHALKRRIERVDLEATTDFGSVDLQNQSDTPLTPGSEAKQAAKKIRPRGVPTSPTQVPASVAGIQLGRMLGSGGMGRVYEGTDTSGQQVAVKLLSPDWSRSRESIERFRQEGAIASSINHPRCVFVRTADTDNGCPYIVMELMSGKTLKDLVKEQGALQYTEALRLITDIADGLQEAHGRGMIHRDVKPANCYLEDNGRVKVGDFGLARSMEQSSDLTTTGGFVGTPLYASPEQIRGAKLDSRTDVYSLCATLYFLLTGQAPFAADHPTQTIARIASEDPPSVREMVPSCPVAVDRILAKGLARDPAKRFQSMEELKASIRPLVDSKMLAVTFGKRFGAICIDLGIYSFVTSVIVLAFTPDLLSQGTRSPWLIYGVMPFWFSYLCLLEKLKGSTPGKLLFRIKVVERQTLELPSWPRACVRTLAYLGLSGFGTDILIDLFRPGQTDWLCFVLQGSGYVFGLAAMFFTVRLRDDRPLLHDWLSGTKVIECSQVEEDAFLANIDPGPLKFASVDGAFPVAFGRFQTKGCLVAGRSTAERPAFGELGGSSERSVFLAEDAALGRQVWIVVDPSVQPIQGRREDRVNRLRYLQSGDSELGRWDAFLAVDGASLADWSMASGGLEWSAVRSILLQFCEECRVSDRNKNACQISSLDQLWIDRRGRLVVLDFPLPGTHAIQSDDLQQPLDVARGIVQHSVADRKLGLGRESHRESKHCALAETPLPQHAQGIVDRLVGDEGERYASIDSLHDDLRGTEGLATTVGYKQRMIQIFLMFLVLSPLFGASLSLVRLGNQIGTVGAFESMVTAEMLRRLASDEVRYAEWSNLMKSGQWLETPPVRDELEGIADEIDRQCADVLRVRYDNAGVIQRLLFASGGIELGFPEKMSDYRLAGPDPTNDDSYVFQGPEGAPLNVNVTPKEFRSTFEFTEAGTLAEIRKPMVVFALGLSSLIVCLLWDTIFRGGWIAWFSGIRYVNRRGRKAGVCRFAVRSIVLWAPCFVLSSIVIAMDIWHPDYSWLTGNLFSVFLISPLIMMLVTLLSLRRGFHDYASGVYPVAK